MMLRFYLNIVGRLQIIRYSISLYPRRSVISNYVLLRSLRVSTLKNSG